MLQVSRIFAVALLAAVAVEAAGPLCRNPAGECDREIRSFLAGRRYSGMQVGDLKPGLVIEALVEGGPAFRAGLRKGDRIAGINGKSFADATPPQFKEALSKMPSGRLFMIIIRGGAYKKIEMRLEPYPKTQIDRIIAQHLAQAHTARADR
ncbi:MAG TPA: PDZ domain-containing protein [Thermoanaerobaculia bacterium]|jgi:S1-C subfamily serine protease